MHQLLLWSAIVFFGRTTFASPHLFHGGHQALHNRDEPRNDLAARDGLADVLGSSFVYLKPGAGRKKRKWRREDSTAYASAGPDGVTKEATGNGQADASYNGASEPNAAGAAQQAQQVQPVRQATRVRPIGMLPQGFGNPQSAADLTLPPQGQAPQQSVPPQQVQAAQQGQYGQQGQAAQNASTATPGSIRPECNGGFSCLDPSIIGCDVCGNGGCKTKEQYCQAVTRNQKQDPCCADIAQTGTQQPGGAQQGTIQPGGAQQGTAQQGAAQQGTAQQGTAQQGTAQQGTAQQGTAQQGTAQQGTAQQGTAQQGTAQQGTAQQGTAQQGTAQQGTAQQNGTQQPGSTTQQCNGGFSCLDPGIIGCDVCGNIGCQTKEQYCQAVASYHQDPCCSGSTGPVQPQASDSVVTDQPGGTGGGPYLSLVNKYRQMFGLSDFGFDGSLEDPSRQAGIQSNANGNLTHYCPDCAQVMAGGTEAGFEDCMLMWICERIVAADQAVCGGKATEYGGTGHHDILVGSQSGGLSKVGCAFVGGNGGGGGSGTWTCSLK